MANIVYLFGAGASAQALPVVNQIPAKLNEFIRLIESSEFQLSTDTMPGGRGEITYNRVLHEYLIPDLKWLLEASSDHASVDTLAKKLFLTNNHIDLKKLKLALSVFFIYEQIRNKPDSRYDTFFASILHNYSNNFPKNIQIISWNYDYQFEKSYAAFSKTTELSQNQAKLNIKEKFRKNDADPNRFTIYKLNGTTGISSEKGYYSNHGFIFRLESLFSKELLGDIIVTYYDSRCHEHIIPSLSFAWEVETAEDSLLALVAKTISSTSVLVVIGYSFPFFNREVDRKILKSMPDLKKVYFQSLEAVTIRERFEAISDRSQSLELVLKHDTTQFFLPNEL